MTQSRCSSPAGGRCSLTTYGINTREQIFDRDQPFARCHAPTLIATGDGGLYVAWFAGSQEGAPTTAIWASEFEPPGTGQSSGSTGRWSQPRIIANVAAEPHWNPVLFALPSGEWVLHFKVGWRIQDWLTWSQTSSDAGRTWSIAGPLVAGATAARGAVRAKPVQLSSGDWLAGSSRETWRAWEAFVDRSPDGLTDWQASAPFALARAQLRGKGVIQPVLWQSSARAVHALLRSTEGVLFRADSKDAGYSWSAAYPTALANHNSAIDIVALPDGMLALACNPVLPGTPSRSTLSIRFSIDNGETWPDRIDIEADSNSGSKAGAGEYAYPALIVANNELIVAYSRNRRSIAVARLSAGAG